MALQVVQCFSCPTKFHIETNKGQPLMAACNDCSAKIKKRLQAKERNAQANKEATHEPISINK